jgi:hypothetical protein
MARPQIADGRDGLQIGRVTAKILNKQSRIANKVYSSLGVELEADNSVPKNISLLGNVAKGLGLGRVLWKNDPRQ